METSVKIGDDMWDYCYSILKCRQLEREICSCTGKAKIGLKNYV